MKLYYFSIIWPCLIVSLVTGIVLSAKHNQSIYLSELNAKKESSERITRVVDELIITERLIYGKLVKDKTSIPKNYLDSNSKVFYYTLDRDIYGYGRTVSFYDSNKEILSVYRFLRTSENHFRFVNKLFE